MSSNGTNPRDPAEVPSCFDSVHGDVVGESKTKISVPLHQRCRLGGEKRLMRLEKGERHKKKI